MTTLSTIFASTTNTQITAAPVDMLTTHNSGEIILATSAEYPATYTFNFNINQGPTISGPWVPLTPTITLDTSQTTPSLRTIPYTRSMRFLQGLTDNAGASSFNITAIAAEPQTPLTPR
jgi:hypothetical protein